MLFFTRVDSPPDKRRTWPRANCGRTPAPPFHLGPTWRRPVETAISWSGTCTPGLLLTAPWKTPKSCSRTGSLSARQMLLNLGAFPSPRCEEGCLTTLLTTRSLIYQQIPAPETSTWYGRQIPAPDSGTRKEPLNSPVTRPGPAPQRAACASYGASGPPPANGASFRQACCALWN
jgi:hypothetical protein